MALHSSLTGADLHEPKGVASASANTAYLANGSGSGSWRKITEDDIDTSSVEINTVYLSGVIQDVSTASSILFPIPSSMTLLSGQFTLGGAISAADASVSVTRSDSSSMGSVVTIEQAGSAEGTSFPFTSTTNSLVSSGGYVKVATDGASTNSVPLYVTLKFERTL